MGGERGEGKAEEPETDRLLGCFSELQGGSTNGNWLLLKCLS